MSNVTRRTLTTKTLSGLTRTNSTVTKDSAIVDGDCIIVHLYVEPAVTVTPPSGWTEITGSPVSGTNNDSHLYYKIAASEGASWTWTHASSFTGANVGAWIGADASNPICPADGITTSKVAINNTGLTVAVPNFTITRTGSMVIGAATTQNGKSLTDHHGFVTEACWSGANGTELDDIVGPWPVPGDGTPWAAGNLSGDSFGQRTFTFNANDFLTGACFAIQPPRIPYQPWQQRAPILAQ